MLRRVEDGERSRVAYDGERECSIDGDPRWGPPDEWAAFSRALRAFRRASASEMVLLDMLMDSWHAKLRKALRKLTCSESVDFVFFVFQYLIRHCRAPESHFSRFLGRTGEYAPASARRGPRGTKIRGLLFRSTPATAAGAPTTPPQAHPPGSLL